MWLFSKFQIFFSDDRCSFSIFEFVWQLLCVSKIFYHFCTNLLRIWAVEFLRNSLHFLNWVVSFLSFWIFDARNRFWFFRFLFEPGCDLFQIFRFWIFWPPLQIFKFWIFVFFFAFHEFFFSFVKLLHFWTFKFFVGRQRFFHFWDCSFLSRKNFSFFSFHLAFIVLLVWHFFPSFLFSFFWSVYPGLELQSTLRKQTQNLSNTVHPLRKHLTKRRKNQKNYEMAEPNPKNTVRQHLSHRNWFISQMTTNCWPLWAIFWMKWIRCVLKC